MRDASHTYKRGDRGAAMLVAVLFFLFASMVVVLGVVTPIMKQASLSKSVFSSKNSYYLAESSIEDILYRLNHSMEVSATETLALNNGITTTIVSDTSLGKRIVSSATTTNNVRKMELEVVAGTGASFNYGIQSGMGGFELANTASITGNVYSNGPIIGTGNTIYGDAISASSTGLIDDIHTTGSAFAHTIRDSNIGLDAHYMVISGTSVGRTSYPNSPDQPIVPLPISDEEIEEFKTQTEAGGVISSPCPYKIINNTTLGPKKITCDLEISGNPTVTLEGPVWVTGNVYIKNTSIIRVSSALGNSSVAIIADKPTDRINSSKFDLSNSSQFFGSGSPTSFVMLISQNNSAENGGSVEAISMDNTATGKVILYAAHGLITINNSANLKQVTAYKIKAMNSANIIYDTGLTSTLFSSGPSAGYDIIDWDEIK